jgi:hypothetical protein
MSQRIANILNSFEKVAEALPPVEPSDRVKNILEKAAICPQLMGIGMDEIQVMDKDQLEGGEADGTPCEEIAEEQGVETEEVKDAVQAGKAVEMEHTNDGGQAKEIAKDHIAETTPEYYDELGEMEETLEAKKEKGLGDPSPEDKEIIMRFLQDAE